MLVSSILSPKSTFLLGRSTNQLHIVLTKEPPRWRFAAFAALANKDTVAYKMTTVSTDGTTSGIYTGYWNKNVYTSHPILESGDECTDIDAMAVTSGGTALLVESVAIERDGFRKNYLCVSVACGTLIVTEEEEEDEADWGGIYCANIELEKIEL